MVYRGDGGAVVRHRHRLGAVADRLRGEGEPGDGVEEGITIPEKLHRTELDLFVR